MKINFRQGIVSSARGTSDAPSYLTIKVDKTVRLSATETPVVLAFAYKDSGNFLVDIRKDVESAWGPFNDTSVDSWLYWDINIATGVISYGSTNLYPVYQSSEPQTPTVDQHWFDTSTCIMKVWDGSVWEQKIRLFAAKINRGITLEHLPFGSQAGVNVEVDAGYILFDESGLPVRRSNGLFFTTDTNASLNFSNTIASFKLDQNVMVLTAVEPLPAYALVCIAGPNQMGLADATSTDKRAIGVVIQDTPTGSISEVAFRGVLTSLDWSNVVDTGVIEFPTVLAGKSLWLVNNGKLSWFRPNTDQAQRVGTIINAISIYLDIDNDTRPQVDSGTSYVRGIAVEAPLETTGGQLPTISINPATVYEDGIMTSADKQSLTAVITGLQSEITNRTTADNLKLDKSGGILTGYLTLSGDPTSGLHAATKNYVDNHPGVAGPQGPKGDKGEKGDKGDTGTVSYDSPAFTGTPTAPTPPAGTNNNTVATTAFVATANSNLYALIVGNAPDNLNSLAELSRAIGNDPNFNITVTNDISNRLRFDTTQTLTDAQKQNILNNIGVSTVGHTGLYQDLLDIPPRPAITGDISVPQDGTVATLPSITTAGTYKSVVVNEKGQVVNGSNPTTLVEYGITDAAPLASPSLTGIPTAPTAAPQNSTAQIATTAFVHSLLGIPSGIATLGVDGKLSTSQIPDALVGSVVYQGVWNALTNTPTLESGVGVKGNYYKVSVAGTTYLDGNSVWQAGDTVIFDGTAWDSMDGTTSEVLSVAGRTGAVTLAVADIAGAAPLASPALTGIPTAPKAAVNTDTSQIATTSFVLAQAASATPYMNGTASPGAATTFSRWDHVHPSDTTRAPLASPALTGTPTAPTAAVDANTTQIATTAYVIGQGYLKVSVAAGQYAPLASPVLTGTPTSPTAAVDTNTTQIATTAYVIGQGYLKSSVATSTYAPLASPTLTGTPTAPTALTTDNSTKIATTAYVKAQNYITSAGAPVQSVAGKTGIVTLTTDDISGEIDGGSF